MYIFNEYIVLFHRVLALSLWEVEEVVATAEDETDHDEAKP